MNAEDGQQILDLYPLSPVQQGMLFHGLLEQHAGVYVVQVSFSLIGDLNQDAFESAWNQLIHRHDPLRTAFVWEQVDQPLQVVGKKAALTINKLDWESKNIEKDRFKNPETIPDYQEWLSIDRMREFNFSSAPLMRVTQFRIAEDHHRVVWTYHHLLLDGWSLPLLLKEWITAYQIQSQTSLPKPESAISGRSLHPFRDYITWLQSQDDVKAKRFWKSYLEGFTSSTPIGILRPPTLATHSDNQQSQDTPKSQTLRRSLAPETSQKLTEFAQRHRLTLSTLIQAAWAILLSRYADQDEVVFGVARSGRPADLTQIENRVGMHINTLPLRVCLNRKKSPVAWLQDLQAHGERQQPFEWMALTDIQSQTDVPRNQPLFESVVIFENYPVESIHLPDDAKLSIAHVNVDEQTHYPFALFASGGEEIELCLHFQLNRCDKHDVECMIDFLNSILTRLANLGDLPVEDSSSLFPALRRPTEFEGPTTITSQLECAHQSFTRAARIHGDKSAIECGEQILTYQELDQQSSKLAVALQNDFKVGKEAIGILLPRSPEMVIAMLAILKAGCHFVPLDPTHPKDRLIDIAKDGDLRAVITLTSTRHLVESESIEIIDFETWDASAVYSSEPQERVSPSDLAYLIFTSGTTGRPKGVPITHLSLANLLQSIESRIEFKQDQCLLSLTTFAFDIATLELLLPLTRGATLVLTDDQKLKDGGHLVDLINERDIDVVQATPAAWRMIMSCWPHEHHKQDDRKRTFLCGGEALPVSLADELLKTGSTIWNVYGPTETTIWSGALRIDGNKESMPIGGPLDNTSFHIVDSKLRPVPPGVPGELCIGGIGLSPGYHQRPDLTRERFVQLDEADSNPIRVYRTGDSVRQTPDGLMEFLGRMDSQIKLRGHRIELGEIETAMESHGEVEEAVAVLHDFGEGEQCIQVFYRRSRNSEEPEETFNTDLRRHLSGKLPAYMLPVGMRELDRFPITPNGKTDRKTLSSMRITRASSGIPPQTQLERDLAKVWKRVLKTDTVGIHDNFFEMGGHSLLILTAQNEIREQMGIKLPIIDFFQHPSLHALANHINHQTSIHRDTDRSGALKAGRSRLMRRRQNQTTDQDKTG